MRTRPNRHQRHHHGRRAVGKTLAAYAAAGFKNVEFPLGRVKEFLQRVITHRRMPRSFSPITHNLRCIGDSKRTSPASATQPRFLRITISVIANAELIAALGGSIIVVGTDGPAPEKSFIALDTIGRTMHLLIQRFPGPSRSRSSSNWSPIVKSLKSAKAVVDAANHPRIGILFDPAHYYCTASKFDDLTPDVVNKIIHVHVDDMQEKPGDLSNCNDDRVLPGEGCLDRKHCSAGLKVSAIVAFSRSNFLMPTSGNSPSKRRPTALIAQ